MIGSLRLASLASFALVTAAASVHAQSVSVWTVPAYLNFGAVPVGEHRTMQAEMKVFGGNASLRVSLPATKPFKLISPTGDVTSLPDGGMLTLQIDFSPKETGVIYSSANISCVNTSCSATLALEGNGTAGAGVASTTGAASTPEPAPPYPNPAMLLLTIPLDIRSTERVLVTITDARGDLVETVEERVMEAGTAAIIHDVSKLRAGSYFYRIHTPESVTTHQFLIAR